MSVPRFCAAGLRAIVESICTDPSIADGPVKISLSNSDERTKIKSNLDGKIFDFHEKGRFTLSSTEILYQHRYLGNNAVHQLAILSTDELKLAIEIIEHTLEQLYEIPQKAMKLNHAMAVHSKNKIACANRSNEGTSA